ncbi:MULTISPECIES: DUF1707 and FHA domain-containing protein [unclassified Streptomyces]|uniref:DUF1707 and FHA domain-containing protein n=1 Tax=unclassified Streptomyces TaxID=2593676 RepID=UPI003250E890
MTSSSESPAPAYEPHTAPVRLSDAERDRALDVLKEGAVRGRLSHDTFMRRTELALAARRSDELAALTADLESGTDWSQRLLRAVGQVSAFPGRMRRAWAAERLPKLLLPAPAPYPLRIGRDPANGLRLNHETVSRMHAELGVRAGVWVLRDLGSANGTTVNGHRVTGAVVVRDGDSVGFGRMHFRLSSR